MSVRAAFAAAVALVMTGCATTAVTPSAPGDPLGASTAGAPDMRVCSQVPEDPTVQPTERQRQARVRLGLGSGYLREGAHEIALRELRTSLELDPDLAEAHGAMALLLNALGKTTEAAQAHREALARAPSNPELHNNYGVFLCQHGELEQADAQFRCALANPLYSTPAAAYANAADCALRANRPDRARQDLESALLVAPDFLPARLQLAQLLLDQGDAATALRQYRRYVDRAEPTAASLALGVRIARAAGDEDRAASYALRLRDRFPHSDEAFDLDTP